MTSTDRSSISTAMTLPTGLALARPHDYCLYFDDMDLITPCLTDGSWGDT
jgi:hypothetical protein